MLDHISIGVRDLAAAKRFYDPVMAALGATCHSASEGALGYGRENADFWVLLVPRPVLADPESGLHICFSASSRAAVDAFHAAGLTYGGGDNGGPGVRTEYSPNYYAAFLVDPEGYRIEAHCGS